MFTPTRLQVRKESACGRCVYELSRTGKPTTNAPRIATCRSWCYLKRIIRLHKTKGTGFTGLRLPAAVGASVVEH